MEREVNILLFLFLCNVIAKSNGFLPTKTSNDRNLYTHSDITLLGFQRAVSSFLVDHNFVQLASNQSDVITKYFGSDNDGRKSYQDKVSEVIGGCNDLQRTKTKEAKYSVNGEQIQEAHLFIIQTKHEIKGILNGTITDAVLSLVRKKIGFCLYVIQSFYSNTNWVEGHGDAPYNDFGVNGKALITIAGQYDSSCRNCKTDLHDENRCRDNILDNTVLTSGYRSGQDVYKVQLQGQTEGKCSHGGPSDTSRNIPATGGINKETNDVFHSPHAYLHQQAAKAAISATVSFLVDNEIGIVSFMDTQTFIRLFSLERRRTDKSLAFCIDTTGSMGDDIKAVKENVRNITLSKIGSKNEPANYVLVTFNDPASKTRGWKITDGNELLTLVSSLTAQGGGDCPEYSFSGLLKAIELSNNESTIYHFTDADAKDCNRMNEVLIAAGAKSITITFLLTGRCGGFECRSTTHRKRTGPYKELRKGSIFDQIAAQTGGSVFNVTKTQIKDILHTLIEKDFPSSEVIIEEFFLPSMSDDNISIYSDADMQVLTIELAGPSSAADVVLKDPEGHTQSFSDGNATRYVSSARVAFSLKHPKPGVWSLKRTQKRDWRVNVTAEASIDVSFNFIATDANGFSYEITDNPLSGDNYTLEAKVINLQHDPVSTEIILLDKYRHVLANFTTSLTSSPTGNTSRVAFEMPNNTFHIQLRCGYEDKSLSFRRASKGVITPVNVRLSLSDVLGNLLIGAVQTLEYTLTNTGDDNETFIVKYEDDKGGISINGSRHEYTLNPREEYTDRFFIRQGVKSGPMTYTVSVLRNGSEEVLQSRSNTIEFTSVEHPVCRLASQIGNCSVLTSDEDCRSVTWTANTSIEFSEIRLQTLFLLNADANVNFDHDNITDIRSPVFVNISGTCCTPAVIINAQDTDSYVGRCSLYFGDPTEVHHLPPTTEEMTTTQKITTTQEITTAKGGTATTESKITKLKDKEDSVNIGMIVGIVVACLIVVIITAVTIKLCCNKNRSMSAPETNTNVTFGKPMTDSNAVYYENIGFNSQKIPRK